MAGTGLCFTLPILGPIDVAVAGADDAEGAQPLPDLPHPSQTDTASLFFSPNPKAHSRKQKPGHIPRPRNAFILFRCDFVQQRVPEDTINDHRDLSRLAGSMWRNMSDAQKHPWFEKAKEEKKHHSQVFPGYRYNPTFGDRPKRAYRRRSQLEAEIICHRPHLPLEPLTIQLPPRPRGDPSQVLPVPTPPPPFPLVDDNITRTRQHQGFPQNDTPHHSTPSLSVNIPPESSEPGPSSMTKSSQICGGFVDITTLHTTAAADCEFGPRDEYGDWSTLESSQNIDNSEHCRSPSHTAAASSIYSLWKDLEIFHEQAFWQETVVAGSVPDNSDTPAPFSIPESLQGATYTSLIPTNLSGVHGNRANSP